MQLAEKVAIITGGTSGIGLAVGHALAGGGARVVLVGRNPERGASAVAKLAGLPGEARFMPADVTDSAAVEAVIESTVQEYGRLDFMFNNAGVGIFGEARDLALSDWKRVIDINLMGVIYGVSAAYPRMLKQRFGHIVNTSSVGGFLPTPMLAPYVASKFGVLGLSHALRMEAAPHGVRVSVVCPPLVATGLPEATTYIRMDRDEAVAAFPGPIMSAEDCAAAILRGISRNKAVITPGAAGRMALVGRYLPFVADKLNAALGRKLLRLRKSEGIN